MAADSHLTEDWLEALAEGKVTATFLRDLLLEHLFSICPVCAREYRSWLLKRSERAAYDRALRPIALPEREKAEPAEARRAAERDFRELRLLPVEECERKIERSRSRFRGRVLSELLLAESDRSMPSNPKDAYRFSRLAQLVAFRSFPSAAEAGVRATARMANAKRAVGCLEEAESLIRFARMVALSEGLASSLLSAELDRYEGQLRIDQRRLDEAENLILRSKKLYEILEDERRVAHGDLMLSKVYYYRGDLSRAIEVGETLLDRLNREREPALYLAAENNLALFLCDAGEYEEALIILDNDPEFSLRFGDRHVKVRRLWVIGRAAAGAGDLAEAEKALRAVRQVFIDEEVGYDAALVSLDLALLFARSGRLRDLKETAEAAIPILQANALHREAAVALRLFIEAVREERASLAFVEEVAAFFRKAEGDPSLAFRGPKEIN